jgi:hypothetical protein
MPIFTCKACGKQFKKGPARLGAGFCSPKCGHEQKRGKGHSEEWMRKMGLFTRGENHPRWKGGCTTCCGYRLIKSPRHARADKGGYVFEHVLVAEKKVGRSLLSYEVAHHVDLDKTNNAPENIIVMGKGKHMRYHQNLNRLFEHWVGA